MKLPLLLLACLGTMGCGADEDPPACPAWAGEKSIASPNLWRVVPLAEDPFKSFVTGDPELCGPGRYGAEVEGGTLWFGIDTIDCAYLTITQPALETLCPGDEVSLRLWHFSLTGASDGYEVALGFGDGEPDLRETILVPAPGKLLDKIWVVDRRINAGEPVTFHLSNHGINSWGLLDVTATR